MTDTEAQLLLQLVQAQGREIAALSERVMMLEEQIANLPEPDEGMGATHM